MISKGKRLLEDLLCCGRVALWWVRQNLVVGAWHIQRSILSFQVCQLLADRRRTPFLTVFVEREFPLREPLWMSAVSNPRKRCSLDSNADLRMSGPLGDCAGIFADFEALKKDVRARQSYTS